MCPEKCVIQVNWGVSQARLDRTKCCCVVDVLVVGVSEQFGVGVRVVLGIQLECRCVCLQKHVMFKW